jgi:uncharacterized RDD family membrane protein YckC
MSSSDCPKCQGPRDAKALYCPFCGIVFSRYVAAPPAPPLAAPAPPTFAAMAPAAAGFAPAAALGGFAGGVAETLYEGPPPLAGGAAWNPYQGPGAAPAPYFSAAATIELATRGSRLIAQFLNGLVFMGIVFGGIFLSTLLASATGNENAFMAGLVLGAGLPLGFVLIVNLRQLAATGQSLGKKWMGIRIVRSSGEKAGLSQLLVMRYLSMQLIGVIPYLGPIIGLVNLLMIFGEEQRCLHDRIADTVVVRA